MGQIAIIENGKVSNIIEGDSAFADSISDTTVVLTNEQIQIGYSYDGTDFLAPILTQEQQNQEARDWRDNELKSTDFIVPLSDYPNRTAWMTYRQELRDWPSTDDFPDNKPTKP